MSRHVVAGILGLALAGCASDRSVLPRSRPTLPPVAMTPPMPSIHEMINGETPRVDPQSLRAGFEPGPAGPAVASAAAPGTMPAAVTANGAGLGRPAPFAAVIRNAGRPQAGQPVAAAAPEPVAAARVPAQDQPPGAASLADEPQPAPIPPIRQADPAPTLPEALAASPAVAEPAPTPPGDGRVKIEVPITPPPDVPPDALAAPPAGIASPTRGYQGDPLLGPNPDVMPLIGELPATRPAAPSPAAVAQVPAVPPVTAANPEIPSPASPAAAGAAATLAPVASGGAEPTPPTAAATTLDGPTLAPEPVIAPPMAAELPPPVELPPPSLPDAAPNGPPAALLPSPTLPEDQPASAPAGVTPPAPATASEPTAVPVSQPTRDPLLGPNPEVMPAISLAPEPSASPAPRRVRLALPPASGTPPSVRDMAENSRASQAPVDPRSSSFPPFEADPFANPRAPGASAPAPLANEPPGEPLVTASPPPAAAPVQATASLPARSIEGPMDPAAPAAASSPEPPVREVEGSGAAQGPAPRVIDPVAAPAASVSSRDPLLGSNPDVMPAMPSVPAPAEIPPARPPVADAATRPASATEPTPAAPAIPATLPSPAKPAQPRPKKQVDPLADPGDLPPLSDPGANQGASLPSRPRGFASVPVSPPAASTDAPANTNTTPPDPAAIRSEVSSRSHFVLGKPAVRVGDDVITLREIRTAYHHRLRSMNVNRKLDERENAALFKSIRNDLIDRSVVLQEARRQLKDPKRYKQFMDQADEIWMSEELKPLLKKHAAANIHELRKIMAEKGEPLDEVREQFRYEFLSRGFLQQRLGPRMSVDLPEMREYYMAHLKDFQLPAQVIWREVVVEAEKSKSRQEARAKADALHARLLRGEDFAAVAKAASDGPTRSEGGLWKTSPGSYGVVPVNAALDTLPIGRISPVIEGPTGFHIVRVESRRLAGPASFAEVQDKIHHAIRGEKVQRESSAYLDKLRKQTIIMDIYDPAVVPASAERVTPAGPAPR